MYYVVILAQSWPGVDECKNIKNQKQKKPAENPPVSFRIVKRSYSAEIAP